VNVNTTDATTGATALLLPAQRVSWGVNVFGCLPFGMWILGIWGTMGIHIGRSQICCCSGFEAQVPRGILESSRCAS